MNRIMFYMLVVVAGGACAAGYNPPSAVDWLAVAAPICAILVLVVATAAVGAAFWMVCTFLEQYSDRASVALVVVKGLMDHDEHGRAKLPEAVSVGGKLPFRLSQLYRTELFQLLRSLIDAIGYWPCYPAYRLLGGA